METIEESDLTDQLTEAISLIKNEEQRFSSLRVLMEATLKQLQRRAETITALKKKLAKAGRKEH